MYLAERSMGTTEGLSTKVTSVVAGDVVTVAEAKQYGRIDISDDDNLIPVLLEAVIETAEKYTNLAFRQKEVTAEYQQYGNEIILPLQPVQTVNEVRRVYQGTATVMSAGDYYVTGQEYKTLCVKDAYDGEQLQIDMTVGYGASSVPPGIKLAILKAFVSAYEDRQDAIGGTIVAQLPNDARTLLNAYRRFLF